MQQELRKVSGVESFGAHHVMSANIQGLAIVDDGLCYEGRLTAWPREAELLWQYWQCPCSSFSLSAPVTYALERPVIVSSARGYSGDVALKHTIFQGNTSIVDADTVLLARGRDERMACENAFNAMESSRLWKVSQTFLYCGFQT